MFITVHIITVCNCHVMCDAMLHYVPLTHKKPANCNFGAVGTTSVYYGLLFAKKLCGKLFCMMQNVMRDMTAGVERRRKTALNGEKKSAR